MKYISSLLLFSFLALLVAGQNQYIGIKGGYSWTNIATNSYAIHSTQPGFSAGFTYDLLTKKNLSFGAEILYDKRGFTSKLILTDMNGNPTGEKYSMHTHYNYFALPLKFGYSMGNIFFGFASIGICPALLLKGTTTYPLFNYNSPTPTYSRDTTVVLTNPSKIDISGLAEIGFGYQITNRFTVATSFRYQYSFTSITNDKYFTNSYIHNFGMTLSLGIKYNLTYKSSVTNQPSTK